MKNNLLYFHIILASPAHLALCKIKSFQLVCALDFTNDEGFSEKVITVFALFTYI